MSVHPKRNAAGEYVMPVIIHKDTSTSFARATHDFCDKTTWYQNSIEVVDEVMTTSDNLTFNTVNEAFIDVMSGILNRQDLHQDKAITVKVDDVEVTSGFTINHSSASITFDSAETGTVKITYWYPTDSKWSIKPDEGYVLTIEHSEIQFAEDIQVNSPLKFEVWITNPYYGVEGHPYEFLERIPYETVQYNSMRDFINESNLGTGVIRQVADLPTDILVFPFNYVTNKQLLSSYGAEVIISVIGDVELTGSMGTATFYLICETEA